MFLILCHLLCVLFCSERALGGSKEEQLKKFRTEYPKIIFSGHQRKEGKLSDEINTVKKSDDTMDA